jgi:hypothetical protein
MEFFQFTPFLVKFTPFLHASHYMQIKFERVCPTPLKVWGLWSIRAQLENLPAEIIELIKEHTLKV